jgi:hypothetical protein
MLSPQLRHPLFRLAALFAVAMLLASFAASGLQGAEPAQQPLRIYLLRGGHDPSDRAVADALQVRGTRVDAGPLGADFIGAEVTLANYDIVLVLSHADQARTLTAAGIAALDAYVRGGGSLITGEWLAQQAATLGGPLADLLPVTACGRNDAPQTSYAAVAPHPVGSAGLPPSFTFNLANFAGSESCLTAKADANVIYSSSNGGGTPDSVGLAVWNVGSGNVASFSTLISSVELLDTNYTRLLQNTVAMLRVSRDLRPPRIRSFTTNVGEALVNTPDLLLNIQASDSGGSGLAGLFIVEYGFSGDPEQPWVRLQNSGWLPFGRNESRQVPWQLTTDPGVHYLQVFVSDRAGNVTASPELSFVSFLPETPTLEQDELKIYRVRPPTGERVTVELTATAGNPDLYVFGPDVAFAPESDDPIEQVTFTVPQNAYANGAYYQIEVVGHIAGAYRLSYRRATGVLAPFAEPTRRPRGSIVTLSSDTPQPEDAELTPPPAEFDVLEDTVVYLPFLTR